jgi:hypothetical protein
VKLIELALDLVRERFQPFNGRLIADQRNRAVGQFELMSQRLQFVAVVHNAAPAGYKTPEREECSVWNSAALAKDRAQDRQEHAGGCRRQSVRPQVLSSTCIMQIEDWDWSYSFGVNADRYDKRPYSDYRHMVLMGTFCFPPNSN